MIDHLKENGPEESLGKLQLETKAGDYKYSLWEHHSDKFLLTSESMFMQKVHYIHNNPVKEGLVERPEEYKYSSARYWLRKPLLDEASRNGHQTDPLVLEIVGGTASSVVGVLVPEGQALPLIIAASRRKE